MDTYLLHKVFFRTSEGMCCEQAGKRYSKHVLSIHGYGLRWRCSKFFKRFGEQIGGLMQQLIMKCAFPPLHLVVVSYSLEKQDEHLLLRQPRIGIHQLLLSWWLGQEQRLKKQNIRTGHSHWGKHRVEEGNRPGLRKSRNKRRDQQQDRLIHHSNPSSNQPLPLFKQRKLKEKQCKETSQSNVWHHKSSKVHGCLLPSKLQVFQILLSSGLKRSRSARRIRSEKTYRKGKLRRHRAENEY